MNKNGANTSPCSTPVVIAKSSNRCSLKIKMSTNRIRPRIAETILFLGAYSTLNNNLKSHTSPSRISFFLYLFSFPETSVMQ